jgi:ubiquinone/menaquinone biosynthesis C-methylase UbiE
MDNVKVIRPPVELKFVQLCILAAQQAKGEYVIFSQLQLDENWLDKTIGQIETLKMKIAIPEEKNYILVNRINFLDTGSFEGLVAKQESTRQTYHYSLLAELNRYADVRGKNILAVGCNRGLECDLLIRMGAKEVTGLDTLEEVGKNYPHPRIRYVRCSSETMPFEDNSFDICCSIATLEHILNPRAALEEMARVTTKRGILYCYAAPLWNSAFGHHKEDIFPNDPWIHLRKKNIEEMKSYYKERSERTTDPISLEAHIRFVYSKNLNQISIREYKSMVADLFRITSPIHIDFVINYKSLELLTPSILSELKDYSEDELLTDSLKLILRKI